MVDVTDRRWLDSHACEGHARDAHAADLPAQCWLQIERIKKTYISILLVLLLGVDSLSRDAPAADLLLAQRWQQT